MSKRTAVTLALFVALFGWALFSRTRAPERGMSRVNLANLEMEAVDKVVVAGRGEITLSKDGEGAWHLPSGRNVDPGLLNTALEAARSIVSGDLMTEDPQRFADFEVDDEKGSHVQIFAGTTLAADFIMGRMVSGGSAVRVGNAVYKVINIFNGSFAHAENEWLDKEVVKRDPEQARTLQVALRNQPAYRLQRQDDGGWSLDANGLSPSQVPKRFDGGAGRMLVMSLSSLRIQEILDVDPGAQVTGLAASQADRLLLSFAAGEAPQADAPSTLELRLGHAKDGHAVYAQVVGRSEIYLIDEGTAASLRRPLSDLQDLTLMAAFVPQQVRTMVVRNGKKWVKLSRPNDHDPYTLASSEPSEAKLQVDMQKAFARAGAVRGARALGLARKPQLARASILKQRQRIDLTVEEPVTGAAADATKRRTFSLHVGGKASEMDHAVYATGTADDQVYVISNALRNTLVGMGKSLASDGLSTDSLSALSPGSLTGLPASVRKQVERQLAQSRQKRPPSP